MKKVSLAAVVAAITAAALAAALSLGSSHREAPLTSIDPTADDTDVYAYSAQDAPDALTVVANWIPNENPAGGPNFYKFDDNAHYYINIDNTGDGKPDVRYLFTFKTKVGNPSSFLYALPGVKSPTDKNLNVQQTYTLTRNGKTVVSNQPTAPNNVGPKTIPNYNAVANQAIKELPGGGKVFAGQRDDPFFVDLGATFDAIHYMKSGKKIDSLAGQNVHSIVLQVPEKDVTKDGKPVSAPTAKNAVVGVWASTERQNINVSSGSGSGGFTQVSRLGNPLVNEVIIPIGKKDQFNRTTPDQDATNYGKYVLQPELATLFNVLFKAGVKTKDRTDIVQAVLQGVPKLNQFPGAGKNPLPTDTLKLNLGVPPGNRQNRWAVLAGDNAGYPNGRRLVDDVVDIDERVIGGWLLPANQGGKKLPLGDDVNQNDVSFLKSFPYVAPPHSGYDQGELGQRGD